MQLTPSSGALPRAEDVPRAVTAAALTFGHRPAITVVRHDRRDEQGFRSLGKWAAKGAHLLQLDAALEPGSRVALDAPAGWASAAVCLAAWWLGAVVTLADGDVRVVHEPTDAGLLDANADVYAIGDAVDGAPSTSGPVEPWATAVQAFPDRPPPSRPSATDPAVDLGEVRWSHAELLDHARAWGATGVLGIEVTSSPATWLPAVVRPFVTGHATVVLAGASREQAAGEHVTVWA